MSIFKKTLKVLKNKHKEILAVALAPVVLGVSIGAASLSKLNLETTQANILSFGNKAVAEKIYNDNNEGIFNKIGNGVVAGYASMLGDKNVTSDSLIKHYMNQANNDYWDKMSSKITNDKDLKNVFETQYTYTKVYINNQDMKASVAKYSKEELFKGFVQSYQDYKKNTPKNHFSNEIESQKIIEKIKSINPDYKLLTKEELNQKMSSKKTGTELDNHYVEFLKLELKTVNAKPTQIAQNQENHNSKAMHL